MGTQAVLQVQRAVGGALQTWGVDNGVPVGSKTVRDPLAEEESERVTFRMGAHASRPSRKDQGDHVFALEFHCLALRGDLRDDRNAYKASELASKVEEHFKDLRIQIIGVDGADAGQLHFVRASWRNGDQRGTIFGSSVDYTLETPKIEHWIVTVHAVLNS